MPGSSAMSSTACHTHAQELVLVLWAHHQLMHTAYLPSMQANVVLLSQLSEQWRQVLLEVGAVIATLAYHATHHPPLIATPLMLSRCAGMADHSLVDHKDARQVSCS